MHSGSRRYPVLSADCSLRLLEAPYIFDAAHDQLYEIDQEAHELLLKCDGTSSMDDILENDCRPEVMELISFMNEEGLLEILDQPLLCPHHVNQSLIPSLRYLLVHTTTRCNLKCKHCYLGGGTGEDMNFEEFKQVVDEFINVGGLKIMLSGGEPLLHPLIWEFLEYLKTSHLRVVMLSNGTLIDKENAPRLKGLVHEVQVSIDGTALSHDALRGEGTFEKTLDAVRYLKAAGIDISAASMIHARNLDEFDEIEKTINALDMLQWSVDLPCEAGYLSENPTWMADLSRAASIFSSYGFGEGAHESTGHYSCGSHLCTVMPNGDIARCGFFAGEPVGNISKGLLPAWERLCDEQLWDLDELDCAGCAIIGDCRGGCRYRAKICGGSMLSPDPLLCLANGVDPKKYILTR
ncbi:MAG: radical SAM protein [ANME-2 cluster archaeon]|nr:radical SAM protein [ANME-2 cluster archaeon]